MTVDLAKLTALGTALRERNARNSKPQANSSWYSIKNLSNDVAEVYIYQEIGEWGITAGQFVEEWNNVTASQINLRINSRGGQVFDGIAIYNAVRNHKSNVTSIVDGVAASAASFIALGANEVLMEKTARMMIHDAGIGAFYVEGNASQMREAVKEVEQMADLLDDLSNNIAGIYVDKAGGTVSEWRSLMASDKWYSSEEAVTAGLADGIVGSDGNAEDKSAKTFAKVDNQPTAWDVEGLRLALKEAF